MYHKHGVRLSENQVRKVIKAINEDVSVRLRLGDGTIPTYLMLTQTDINHLAKSSQVHLSKTQLKSNKHIFELLQRTPKAPATPKKSLSINPLPIVKDPGKEIKKIITDYKQSLSAQDLDQISAMINNLLMLKEPPQNGESIFKLALPFIKQVLPKVLGTLGLAAASGAVSGATHKATSGRGAKYTKGDAMIIQDLYGKMYGKSIFADKMEGGFIGTLLAGLAGSLLPSLLGGKGLYRAGVKSGSKLKKRY